MSNSIELQVISRILTTQDNYELDKLCSYDTSYYSIFNDQIEFILDHKQQFDNVPDPFTFQSKFNDFVIIQVNETLEYLEIEIKKNKQQKLLLQTINQLQDLGSDDVLEAWDYLNRQCEKASELDTAKPVDIIKDAEERAQKIIEYNKQARIPTGFKEIDEIMYGGLSTVEEFLLIIARTNAGKSWICTKLMESAQDAGFPVVYYSPEMQSSFIGTRFDTWRGHFKNSDLHRGQYSQEYKDYIKELKTSTTGAIVVEDCDMSEGKTTVRGLETIVRRSHAKLLIIDGLSYIAPAGKYANESLKYKDICGDLFKLSKTYGCAVVVALQANRETRENRDENGEPFPTIYNASESDHPARIATQVFALRQIYEQHILELRLEKTRNARNEKPVFAYTVDFNSGNLEFAGSQTGDSVPASDFSTPMVSSTISDISQNIDIIVDDDDIPDNVVF